MKKIILKTSHILWQGKRKRMMPLTKNLPKPLLEYSGVPILERILLKLKSEDLII